MTREPAVRMLRNAMISFADSVFGVNVHNHISQVFEMMQQLVADFTRNFVAPSHREVRSDGNVEFNLQAMTDPSCPYFAYIGDSLNVMGSVDNGIEHLRFNPIKHSDEYRLA